MNSIRLALDQAALLIPVYFHPSVAESLACQILEDVFACCDSFCRFDRILAVVDRDTTAERILKHSSPGSSFSGCRTLSLARNRGKAGAVEEGLRRLLETTDASYFVTRDCDGDHVVEDVPRLVAMAEAIRRQTGNPAVAVMGGRPSLEKPMGWIREEWEVLTNRVLVELLAFAAALQGRVLDRRFWNSLIPDIQSGYRAYSRGAAEWTVESLAAVPEQKEIQTFACEFVPFAELTMKGTVWGQVQRQTLVEQPVSSYREVDFAGVYGRLLEFVRQRLGIGREVALQAFDNHLSACSLYFTDWRQELLRCRTIIHPESTDSPRLSPFL